MTTPEFLPNQEGTHLRNQDELYFHAANPELLSLNEVRASRSLVNAALTEQAPITPDTDSIDGQPVIEHVQYNQLSEEELSARLKQVFRKDKINGTRTDFDLAA
jgi:hypothetical protein